MKAGVLVIYKSKCATISSVNGDKLDIRIEGGASRSVRPKDVEFLHAGPVAELPPAQLENPNFEELLELMDGERVSFEEFCDLAYGATNVNAAWSCWQLLQSGKYVTGTLESGVVGRSLEEIAATEAVEQAKAQAQQDRVDFLERIRKGALLPNDLPAMREIEQVALGESEKSKILRDLSIAPEAVNAHKLLLKLGVWDEFVNPWPSRYGVELDDPDLEVPPIPEEEREDLTHLTAYAIDDASSHDPDDAISFENGLIYVHIADVAAVIEGGTPLDEEAEHRGANLYLPEVISHMLPRKATEMLGLGLSEISMAMTFVLKIHESGEPELLRFFPSKVRVERRAYEEVDLNEPMLVSLTQLLDKFRDFRANNGALFIDLPEVKVKVVEKEVVITPIAIIPVRELVANSMLATGYAVAKWAEANDIPMPYTTQPEPDNRDHVPTLAGMFACRKGCAPSTVSTSAGKHAGLGLEPYVRVTSPLRRYGDLLAHQQLRRYLKGEELLGSDYIEERLAVSERSGLVRRKLERQSNEFWKLVYWSKNSEWRGQAVLVFQQDERLTFMIPEFAYEYKNRFGGDVKLDDKVNIKIGNSDPVNMMARFIIER